MDILKKLGNEWLFFDGGTGTILQEQGLAAGELPETWNITHRDQIVELHKEYLSAGADIIKTNTFGANGLKFNDYSEYSLSEIVDAALYNAKKAKSETRRDDAYIALDIGPSGKLLKPMGDLDFEDAISLFSEVIKLGVKGGADLILIETMSDSYETKAAVLAAKENSNLPIFVTNIYGNNGKLLTGGSVESVVALLEGLGVDAIGINCGMGPEQMIPIVKEMVKCATLPIIVNPNAGLPRSVDGKTVFDIGPEAFSDIMEIIAGLGVQVIGGCCGTTPKHIEILKTRCSKIPFIEQTFKHRSVISSFSQAVILGEKPIIIGERINPTGKSKFKQALRDNNIEYVLGEGLKQEDAGAHVLDVNVGLPGIDESEMMEKVIKQLQSIIALPLQIDTSDIKAMERGMRIYNGKPMVNSLSGKMESMEAVFPLIKKYGGVVVALALDETGIPETVDGRIAIAKKIYETGEKYGISKDDIIIDALSLTISSESGSAIVTLDTLKRVRDELDGNTILGVSNISFGLPQREIINSNFFTMALQNGLSCGIINPNNEAMMNSYRAFMALYNLDPQCGSYIAAYGGVKSTISNSLLSDENMTLGEAVERGMATKSAEAAKKMLDDKEPLVIVNTELIPALDRVGKQFETGTLFLPQLLMSAEAAQAAFEIIKSALKGEEQAKKGKIILATVKGDIHDIGKNIVKVLLDNYGYEVIDLGKDVSPEIIVNTAIAKEVLLVGLSALMTTTVVSMEATIKLLHDKKPDTKIVVGGAVLTADYAESIGADRYAKDAMATVHYAQEIIG